jgi:metallo-beta-lactamase class B
MRCKSTLKKGACVRVCFNSSVLLVAMLLATTASAEVAQPDPAAVRLHLAKARALAGGDLYSTYVQRCITAQAYPQYVNDLQRKGPLPAMRVFDQLYFVGQNDVSSWALETSEGIVLFDALNGPDDVNATIVPGLKKLGLEPARIRYIVVTHAHGDHFGGVNTVKALSGARIVSTSADWQEMDRLRTQPPHEGSDRLPPEWAKLAPERDMTVADGEVLKLGTTILHFYVTPGHTPGTLTTLFDVTDSGKPHRVALYGGLGLPRTPEAVRQYDASLERFAGIARSLKVDTIIANHQTQDDSRVKLEELRWRGQADKHPYVLGTGTSERFFEVQAECGRAELGRMGFAQ